MFLKSGGAVCPRVLTIARGCTPQRDQSCTKMPPGVPSGGRSGPTRFARAVHSLYSHGIHSITCFCSCWSPLSLVCSDLLSPKLFGSSSGTVRRSGIPRAGFTMHAASISTTKQTRNGWGQCSKVRFVFLFSSPAKQHINSTYILWGTFSWMTRPSYVFC